MTENSKKMFCVISLVLFLLPIFPYYSRLLLIKKKKNFNKNQ